MYKILEILVPLILIVILLACMMNDEGNHFRTGKSHCMMETFTAGESDDKNIAMITMVHAKWCGFCKKAKPEWNKLKEEFENKKLMGYTLKFQDLEETRDKDKITSEYPVNGYPTFFIEVDGKRFEFNSIEKEDMLKKIKSKIGKESNEMPSEMPEMPPKMPEMPPKMPEMPPKMPEMPPKMPEMPPKMPEMPPKMPEMPPKMPEMPLAAHSTNKVFYGCNQDYGEARLKSVDNNLLFNKSNHGVMGYSDCSELEFAPINVALKDTQPLKAIPMLSDSQLPAPGIDAVNGIIRPDSFGKVNNSNKEAHVTMVYADWCGFSQKALPEWKELTNELDGTVQNGYTLMFDKIDESKNKDLIKSKYSDVRGFPTYVVEIKENGQIVKKEMFNGIKKQDMENKLMNILN